MSRSELMFFPWGCQGETRQSALKIRATLKRIVFFSGYDLLAQSNGGLDTIHYGLKYILEECEVMESE